MKYKHLFLIVPWSILVSSCSYLNIDSNNSIQLSESQYEGDVPIIQEDGNEYYYYFDEKVFLKEHKELIVLKFSEKSFCDRFMSEDLTTCSFSRLLTSRGKQHFNNNQNIVVLECVGDEFDSEYIRELRRTEGVEFVSFLTEYNGKLSGTTGDFFVKPKASFGEIELRELAESYGCVISRDEKLGREIYIVSAGNAENNAIQLARLFYETGFFEFTSPNFCHFDIQMSSNYNSNVYYSDQWGLKNTGQYGNYNAIDINIEPAWEITQGSDNIIVAILDTGVDWNHPDLASNIVGGYDAFGSPFPGEPLYEADSHGTAVAGVIGAINNSIGIIGVAPDCKLMSVRVLDQGYTDNSYLITGINWAVNHGADVLNCSWGDIEPCSLFSSTINNAITQGRDGNGCVFVFSSGNDDGSVSYPATLNNVLAVGAISYQGVRKQASSSLDWGSNYGNQLDVMAPGDRIPTTDRLGIHGLNSSVLPNYPILISEYNDQNYTRWFDQTSSAAPHAAGVAALALSLYPDLTQTQVRRLIELSCTKLLGYTYSSDGKYPGGTRNNEVGYGLINAYGALLQASDYHQINVLDSIPGFDFTLINNSSYLIDGLYVELYGQINGTSVRLIGQDPGDVAAGTVIGYPYYRGENLLASPGSPISNVSLDISASTPGYFGYLRVGVSIDSANPTNYETKYFGFGESYQFDLSDTTVPNSSRRRLYIVITNPI